MRKLVIVLACVLGALTLGIYLGGHPGTLPAPFRDAFVEEDRALRSEIIREIKRNFHKEVDEDELRDASYKGIVRALDDRFSQYFTPEETKLFREAISGQFSGVGMTVDEERRGLLVVSVFKGSPAEKAGIRGRDVITEADGHELAGKPLDVATARIKGKPGTEVTLTVVTPERKSRRITVERARIDVPVTRGSLKEQDGEKLGVVQLATFSDGAHGQLRQEVQRLLRRGARGLVLDLRGNGGGLLTEAVLVASIFVEDGKIVSTDGRTKRKRTFEARGKAIRNDIPLVVLVDRGSASASEIVTGAIRDRGRGTIVGARTFGKGVFQEIEPLSNGGTLEVTVGSYFLPKGENITDKGIEPSVKARDNPRTRRDEALPIALETLRSKLR